MCTVEVYFHAGIKWHARWSVDASPPVATIPQSVPTLGQGISHVTSRWHVQTISFLMHDTISSLTDSVLEPKVGVEAPHLPFPVPLDMVWTRQVTFVSSDRSSLRCPISFFFFFSFFSFLLFLLLLFIDHSGQSNGSFHLVLMISIWYILEVNLKIGKNISQRNNWLIYLRTGNINMW